jgi:hypothetical protein
LGWRSGELTGVGKSGGVRGSSGGSGGPAEVAVGERGGEAALGTAGRGWRRQAVVGGCAGKKGERNGERRQRVGDRDEEDDGGVHGRPAQGCAAPRPYHPGRRRGVPGNRN